MGSGTSTIIEDHNDGIEAFDAYRYSPEKILGEGTYSVVYHGTLTQNCRWAMDKRTKIPKDIAIKLIDKGQAPYGVVLQAIQEAKFLTTFQHSNVIKVYEYFETPSVVCIVMEIVNGGNLNEKIASRGHLSESDSMHIFQQLASVAASLSSAGYVHRDLCAENIMFNDKFSLRIKVVNFGNIEVCDKPQSMKYSNLRKPPLVRKSSSISSSSSLAELYDSQTDVFAIGVLLYFMLSGTYPFQCSEPLAGQEEIFSSILHGELNFRHPTWRNVSYEAKQLIEKILIVKLGKYITAQEILSSYPCNSKTSTPVNIKYTHEHGYD